MVQYPDHPGTAQGIIHFDMQCLSVEIVHYVERAEPAAIAQRIAHEIHRPGVIGRYGFNKRLLYPLRRRFAFLLMFSPISLYTRWTRLWFHPCPSRRNLLNAFPKPSRGKSSAFLRRADSTSLSSRIFT